MTEWKRLTESDLPPLNVPVLMYCGGAFCVMRRQQAEGCSWLWEGTTRGWDWDEGWEWWAPLPPPPDAERAP